MVKVFRIAGDASGALGALICLVAGVNRLLGGYYTFGVESSTVFQVGIAAMVFGCFLKVAYLGRRQT